MKKLPIAIIFFLMCVDKNFAQTCLADAGQDTSICPGQCVVLGGNTPGSDTSMLANEVNYSWMPTTGLNNPALAHPSACPSATTVYTLQIFAINSLTHDTICIATDQVTVSINSTCLNPTTSKNYLPDRKDKNDLVMQEANSEMLDEHLFWNHSNLFETK